MLKYCLLILLALNLSAYAQEGPKGPPKHDRPRPELTETQKKLQAELLQKYDANKNGKLDPEERKQISEEDRKKMRDAHFPRPRGPQRPPPHKDGPPHKA